MLEEIMFFVLKSRCHHKWRLPIQIHKKLTLQWTELQTRNIFTGNWKDIYLQCFWFFFFCSFGFWSQCLPYVTYLYKVNINLCLWQAYIGCWEWNRPKMFARALRKHQKGFLITTLVQEFSMLFPSVLF